MNLNLIKNPLISYVINKKEAEPMLISKANLFTSFKYGEMQFLDIMKFWREQHLLTPYEWFDSADKLDNQELPPNEAFFSKLRNNNSLDKNFKK